MPRRSTRWFLDPARAAQMGGPAGGAPSDHFSWRRSTQRPWPGPISAARRRAREAAPTNGSGCAGSAGGVKLRGGCFRHVQVPESGSATRVPRRDARRGDARPVPIERVTRPWGGRTTAKAVVGEHLRSRCALRGGVATTRWAATSPEGRTASRATSPGCPGGAASDRWYATSAPNFARCLDVHGRGVQRPAT